MSIDWASMRKNFAEMEGMAEISLKMNNCATNDPCAICGERTDPQVGPELFLADSWPVVCDVCAEQRAPELLRLRDLYTVVESQAREDYESLVGQPSIARAGAAEQAVRRLTATRLERLSGGDYMRLQAHLLNREARARGEDPGDVPFE